MIKTFFTSGLVSMFLIAAAGAQAIDQMPQNRVAPTLEQRVADLEAYVNNGNRVTDNDTNVAANLGTYDQIWRNSERRAATADSGRNCANPGRARTPLASPRPPF
jgi:hypothetical protein